MNIIDCIGNTPLIKLKKRDKNSADIYVKLEQFNAGFSVKSRVAKAMVKDAIENDILKPGDTIIEATGGNTGMGLAIMSTIYKFKFVAVVPDNYSRERIAMLKHYNAEVILADSKKGNDSHILKTRELQECNPNWVCLDQFSNTSCINAHYYGTAQEIIEKITPDAFVACVGSGGTFTGVSKRLKQLKSSTKCYVAQPNGCDILKGTAIQHKIQGVSLGIIPPLLDYSLIDGTINVDYADVKEELLFLLKNEAIFLGISSGANIVAARALAREIGDGGCVCTVAPDGGQYYKCEILPDV